ncbi:MAG: phenylalanine--tRNA ligase subunit alpha [Deltaproteobacteria bacterium]|nr:phenylalanine--tRNA ligase subunit alpha [Deltaproteobacteria bacterium]
MIDNIQRIREEARIRISSIEDLEELDRLRVHYLGKKGLITTILHQLKNLEDEKRRELGATINKAKDELESEISLRKNELRKLQIERELEKSQPIDVTLPGSVPLEAGSLHPITRVTHQMVNCLKRIGFSVVSGPEVELEYYNFEALNTPEHHPARDLQDTFYINKPVLLRSHTSPVQIRTMKSKQPPLQVLAVGKVYRSDYDVTHTPMFHQMEGLMVDHDISLADLKGLLGYFIKNIFGARPLRFRPSYFPFVEPGAEVDMQCVLCKGNGRECRMCSSTGWLEICGCGMVHPNVFKAVNYDPDRYTGLAFGMGIERIAMLKYGIEDLRSFFENDYRMLEQF